MPLLDVSDSFKDPRIKEWFAKKVKAKTSRSVSTSLIDNFPKESKIHILTRPFSWAIRTGKIAGRVKFDKKVTREVFFDEGLCSDFEDCRRKRFGEPGIRGHPFS